MGYDDSEKRANQKRERDYFRASAALLESAERNNAGLEKYLNDVRRLSEQFGITTDALGFHHIADPLVAAIRRVKIEPGSE